MAKQPKPERFEFPLPDGFETPKNLEDGDEFDAVATVRKKGDTYCLVELDGMPMPGYDEEESPKEEADETPDEEQQEDDQKQTIGQRVRGKAMKGGY